VHLFVNVLQAWQFLMAKLRISNLPHQPHPHHAKRVTENEVAGRTEGSRSLPTKLVSRMSARGSTSLDRISANTTASHW
jgi:hypothetical protein